MLIKWQGRGMATDWSRLASQRSCRIMGKAAGMCPTKRQPTGEPLRRNGWTSTALPGEASSPLETCEWTLVGDCVCIRQIRETAPSSFPFFYFLFIYFLIYCSVQMCHCFPRGFLCKSPFSCQFWNVSRELFLSKVYFYSSFIDLLSFGPTAVKKSQSRCLDSGRRNGWRCWTVGTSGWPRNTRRFVFLTAK